MIRTSIIIPTRNRASMLRDAIESALAAGGETREILVIDDGSTDETPELLAQYAEPVRTIRVEHGERSRARNLGVQEARGEWVVFLDDDDLLLPGGLTALEAVLETASSEVAVAYGRPRYRQVTADGSLLATLPARLGAQGWILQELLCGNFLVMGNILARREVLLRSGGFELGRRLLEDYDLWLRIAAEYQFLYCDVEVGEIRLHDTNTSRAVEEAGRATQEIMQRHLLAEAGLKYARGRSAEGASELRVALARLCMDLARRRWWEGEWAVSRRAVRQAFRHSAPLAIRELGELWRLWIPRFGYR